MPINTSRVYFYGYKLGSRSLKALATYAQEHGITSTRRSAGQAPPRKTDTVVVWGASAVPDWVPSHHINTPDAVAVAANKLKTLLALKEHNVPIPEFTTDIEEAKSWLPKHWVVARTLLRASGGKGIVLAKEVQEIVQAPLYVKYKRKDKEYRVHVFKGTIIHVQEKRQKLNVLATNKYVRNHTNGWVFCHLNIVVPDDIKQLALDAITALHLDFGAVDIVYNSKTGKAFVLEVNTAPGLEGTTLNVYGKAIFNV